MSRKEQYPGGVKLTEKTARTLAMQEFGTARGLTKSTSFVGAYFMEFGNLRIEICADAACIAVRVVMAHGTGSSVKYFDPDNLQENFKAIVKYAALTIAGIMLFREGAARALAYRGYFAVGGEVFALFLPIFYYCLSRTVRDLITDIKNGFKPEYEED